MKKLLVIAFILTIGYLIYRRAKASIKNIQPVTIDDMVTDTGEFTLH